MGLNGKVKTLDIYYYRPENTSSFFTTKYKKGEKWEEDGIHHYHFHFNIDGNLAQCNEYDKQENIIRKTDYTYETWGHTSIVGGMYFKGDCRQPANIDIIKLPKITRTTTALFFMFSLCVTMFRRKDNKKEPVLKYN